MYHKVYETRSFNDKDKGKYTAWTSEMDRCLTKILVEQANQGNKVDSFLKPTAYMAAMTALNGQFGLELTKEHIKNRLKTWKKQYGILKELLAQKGFEWDEVQNMVVADNSVWNDYLKVHPVAKFLRAKVFENYDELCVIVGNDQLTGSPSPSAAERDMDFTATKEGVDSGNVYEVQSDDKQTRNLRWTEGMDHCLGKVLVEQVRKGCKVDNILQREAYDAAVSSLNENFGPDLTREHIRNRLKTWKKQYGILKELLSHTGFKWDAMRKMVIASDAVWSDYVKTHPDARSFRGRVIENFGPFCIIFHNDTDDMEIGYASPLQCRGLTKDQMKNVRWTKEMDDCLCKVLVEQVILGNKSKVNNNFNSAAYLAAVSALNENFQLDLTKEHIRNHLKTWKKLYDILKEILDQPDFEWDERRKMVVANETAWNKYIQINPDARLFQGRVIKKYDELRFILGYDDPPESCPLNGAEVNLDLTAENEAVDTEDAFHNRSDNTKEKMKYVTWTDEMDRCLAKQLVEQAALGNKLEKSFKPIAFSASLGVLNKKFGLDLTKENIKNRLRTWKKQFGLVKEILSHGGFMWDDRKNMVIGSDFLWNEYIKANPEVRQLRARSIENYDELCIIIGNDPPSGYAPRPAFRADMIQIDRDNEDLIEAAKPMLDDEEMSHDEVGDGIQGSSQQTRARPSSSSHSEQPSKRRRDSEGMVEIMRAVAANIGRIADALTESNKTVCLDELFDMVQAIPGFDDDLVIEACEYLSFDDRRARMFMKLDERLRKLWLLKRLRGLGVFNSNPNIS